MGSNLPEAANSLYSFGRVVLLCCMVLPCLVLRISLGAILLRTCTLDKSGTVVFRSIHVYKLYAGFSLAS